MVRKSLTKVLFAGLTLSASSLALAADGPALMTGASTDMLADTCDGCHGISGVSEGPAIPTIAGISEEYMIELMLGFQSGDVPSTIMGRIAKGYSEDEITQISKHFSSQKFAGAAQEFDAGKAKKGAKLHDKYCEKCHAEGGSSAEDDSGILAGQWTPYLHWSISDFREGHREMPKKMKKKMSKMIAKEGDEGVDALLNYYASQK